MVSDALLMCQGPSLVAAGARAAPAHSVCQARCGCQQRCALVSGMPACVPPASAPVVLGGNCSDGIDDCSAGSVCLGEALPAGRLPLLPLLPQQRRLSGRRAVQLRGGGRWRGGGQGLQRAARSL